MSSQKLRQHRFVEKSPILAALIMCFLWFVVVQLLEVGSCHQFTVLGDDKG